MHSPLCAPTWAMCKACHTSLPFSSCNLAHFPHGLYLTPPCQLLRHAIRCIRLLFQRHCPSFFSKLFEAEGGDRNRGALIASISLLHFAHSGFSQGYEDQRHHLFQEIFILNLRTLHDRFEELQIRVNYYLEGWFACMFAKVPGVRCF